ncbi:NPC intracellular cholesterol transporter 2-like [Toxorhynchites rutilus septentrionalis]|uniref:NPC intracellular cholesterol transporter 2-like n=1 Tax=Toxorhynchites rutilus septentrionalis TaxID=329112 RepID=UPI00247B20A5|nr:NPC intracellular cholesterol transporter 2-like [Toxorhynchites rutilus septentrionalis]
MFKLLLLAALIPAVMLQNADNSPHHEWSAARYTQCKGGQPMPRAVRIENCPGDVCDLRRGSNANMALDFTASAVSSTLRVTATAYVFGIAVPYELPSNIANACVWLDRARCPIDQGEELSYILEFPIGHMYPAISLEIEISLLDDASNSQACFKIQAQVV